VSFVDQYFRPLTGGLSAWESDLELPDPLPDFEYSRLCAPEGTAIDWAPPLASSNAFTQRCRSAFGTNQALALSSYYAAGIPTLDITTVCVADTGVHVNHPDLSNRLHPNSIDANYRNYQLAAPRDRPAPGDTISGRYDGRAVGLPRQAIKERPASHGTETAGILARCTAGFGKDGSSVRILPASVKSARTITLSGYQLKSPISAFIKLVACLNQDFPVGSYTPAAGDRLQNTGDVRVVSTSASVPPSYFTEAEWRVVAPLIGKAAGSIAEDLRTNDRIYVFAAGNDAQPEPNRPCEMDYVIGVTATMAYDGSAPWSRDITGEGANLGLKCIAAPGYGLITSTIAPHPNLAYLPPDEFRQHTENFSTPPRKQSWEWQRNTFGASSGATPQVAALAALLYAQDTFRDYDTVQALIYDSVGGRLITATWGESRGIIDYEQALAQGW
jgi:subtilisin family serine protease